MKNKKNTIMLIMVITISMVLLSWNKSYSYKMDNNEIEEKEIERKEFGIYYQTTGEEYEEKDTFPIQGYLLNTTKTECHEYGTNNVIQNAVTQSLTNGVIDGSIIVQSTKSMYCKIYFDKDEKPTVTSFNIAGKTSSGVELNNGFTYQTLNLPFSFNYTDKESNVVQYCISEINNSDNCIWIQLNGKSGNYTLTNINDGLKTLYIYLKDKANNISDTQSNQITVDKTLPQVTLTLTGTNANSFVATSGYTHTTTVNYNATVIETNPESYCVGESSCSSNNQFSTTLISGQVTIGSQETSHNVVINVKDKAGNIGSTTSPITLDTQNPTITLSNGTAIETSITVNVNASDSHGIGNVTCTAVGNNETKTGTYNSTAKTCTFNSLKDGTQYTITGVATDNSGRKSISNQINVVTIKEELTRADIVKDIFNGKEPAGLSSTILGESPKNSSTYFDDMYRFVGVSGDLVNNWICFGTIEKCTLNDDYMYRIIGITRDGRLKLLKVKSISEVSTTTFVWNKAGAYSEWGDSLLFKRLNGKSDGSKVGYEGDTNIFLGRGDGEYTYLSEDSNWYKMIEDHEWIYGHIGKSYESNQIGYTSSGVYKLETGQSLAWGYLQEDETTGYFWNRKVKAKVGLIYLADLYWSSGKDHTLGAGGWSPKDLGWIGTGLNLGYWTMTGFGDIFAIRINYQGAGEVSQYSNYDVMPVFYLNAGTKISKGTGTDSDPFIIVA